MRQMIEGDLIIRVDSKGDGHYLAPRGNRLHEGVDYIVTPGENILMPFDGYLIREARPYADGDMSGCVLQSKDCTLKVFYMEPFLHLRGAFLKCGTVIGKAQDIRTHWGSSMTPHLHVQVESMNVDKLWGL